MKSPHGNPKQKISQIPCPVLALSPDRVSIDTAAPDMTAPHRSKLHLHYPGVWCHIEPEQRVPHSMRVSRFTQSECLVGKRHTRGHPTGGQRCAFPWCLRAQHCRSVLLRPLRAHKCRDSRPDAAQKMELESRARDVASAWHPPTAL